MTKGVWFRNKELHPLMWHRCYFRITTTTKSVAKINVKIEQMKKTGSGFIVSPLLNLLVSLVNGDFDFLFYHISVH